MQTSHGETMNADKRKKTQDIDPPSLEGLL